MAVRLFRRREPIPAWAADIATLGADATTQLLRRVLVLSPTYLAIDAFEMPGTDASAEPFRAALLEHSPGRQTGIVVPVSDHGLVDAFCRFAPYSADAVMGRTGAADLIVQCLDGETVLIEMTDEELQLAGVELTALWRRVP